MNKENVMAKITGEMVLNAMMGFDGNLHDYLLGIADAAKMFLDEDDAVAVIEATKEVFYDLEEKGMIE